jgi:hypothetical protein
MVITCIICFNILKLCIVLIKCICVFRMVLTIVSPDSINRLGFVAET